MATKKESESEENFYRRIRPFLLVQALRRLCEKSNAPPNVLQEIDESVEDIQYQYSFNERRQATLAGKGFGEEVYDHLYEAINESCCSKDLGYDNSDDCYDKKYFIEGIDSVVTPDVASFNRRQWRSALDDNRVLFFRYVSGSSGLSDRKVIPLGIRDDYADGYCLLREADRVFRFDRMFDVQMLSKKESNKIIEQYK